jgi:hypothetical protein
MQRFNSILIPQMAYLVETGVFCPLDFRCDYLLCFHELSKGWCVSSRCSNLHLKDLYPMEPKRYIDRCKSVLPRSLHKLFSANLKTAMAGHSWTLECALRTIASVYGSVIKEHPLVICESVHHADHSVAYNVSASFEYDISFLEDQLLANPRDLSLMHSWYYRVIHGRVHDDLIRSFFLGILSTSDGLGCPDWHILMYQHYGCDLRLRMPKYEPPPALLSTDGRVLSSYINCIIDDPFLITRLFSVLPDTVVTIIARARYYCEHEEGLPKALSYIRSLLAGTSWNARVILSMFCAQLSVEQGIYTHWFLPFPFQFSLDHSKYPIITGCTDVVNELLSCVSGDADSNILRWLLLMCDG